MAWNKNPMKLPGLAKPNPYTDQNLNSQVPLKLNTPMGLPSDSALSPNRLAKPPMAPVPGITRPEKPLDPENRKEHFRKLAGVLGGLKKPQV